MVVDADDTQVQEVGASTNVFVEVRGSQSKTELTYTNAVKAKGQKISG